MRHGRSGTRLTPPSSLPRWLLALATFVGAPIQADLPAAPARVEEGLARLVDDALAANLELRAGSATVEQRLAALDQARARYLPVIDFAARYSMADGGRTIDFPAADLLNPVYERLDQMLVADGQSPRFPRVANQEIELQRPHEQEPKLVLEQPIYEPRLAPGVEAGRQELSRSEADLSALRARVVRDMRQAYYQWLAEQQAAVVLDATLELARANLRRELEPVSQRPDHARPCLSRRSRRARGRAAAALCREPRPALAELREPAPRRAPRLAAA